ncbi:MAG: hypothetical protein AB7F86_19900 [Bdellovibrionales bacterium]
MKWACLVALLVSTSAWAQFSEQETDSKGDRDSENLSEDYGPGQLGLWGRKFDVNLFSLASMETDKANDEGGRLSTYNYVTFSSYVGWNYKFLVRVPFTYGTAGTDRFNGTKTNPEEMELQDIILGARNPELMYLPWDLSLYWAGQIYLPTSKFSRKSKMITRLNNKFIVAKVFSRYFEMDYTQTLDYYHQSQTTYQNTFQDEAGFERTATSNTKRGAFQNSVTAWGKFNPKTGVGWRVSFDDNYYNKSVTEQRERPPSRTIETGPQVRFPFGDYANFILGYSDVVDREGNREELGKFLAKNTQWTLLSFLHF